MAIGTTRDLIEAVKTGKILSKKWTLLLQRFTSLKYTISAGKTRGRAVNCGIVAMNTEENAGKWALSSVTTNVREPPCLEEKISSIDTQKETLASNGTLSQDIRAEIETDEVELDKWKDSIRAVEIPPVECKSGGKVEHIISHREGYVTDIVSEQLDMPKVQFTAEKCCFLEAQCEICGRKRLKNCPMLFYAFSLVTPVVSANRLAASNSE